MNHKPTLDEHAAYIFQEDPDVYDWRIRRISHKESGCIWQDDDSKILRNVFKEIQYLLQQRDFAKFDTDGMRDLFELERKKEHPSAAKLYGYACCHNRAVQEYKYLDNYLKKLTDIINDDIRVNTSELQKVRTDYEGHPYIELIPFDMDEILGKTLDKEDQSPE